MKKLILAAMLAALPAAAQAGPPPARPKLIVAISVDQFSAELFARYRPTYRKGLRTLWRGIAYPVGYQSHGGTETCPGHSVILTGRYPAGTGIVANAWYDAAGNDTYCVSVPGQSDPKARGPQNMRVTTLGDWIKTAEPGARTFAVSAKDRAAITMAGKHADGVYWWEDGTGFTTSPSAGPATPAVTGPAGAFNAALFAQWRAAPPTLWPRPSKRCAALQKPYVFGEMPITGRVPPEMAAGATDGADFLQSRHFQDIVRVSPTMDGLTADFAIDLIRRERLGHGPATDVLAVSFSGTDYVGHRLGNGGAEMCVQQEAVDRAIGRLLKAVRAQRVPVMVMLTADHGGTDAAERQHDHDGQAARVDRTAFAKRLDADLRQQLGIDFDPFLGNDPEQLYIDPRADKALEARIRAAAIAWLRQQPEVREVHDSGEIAATVIAPGTPPDRLTNLQRLKLSYDSERSPDIVAVFAERSSFGIPRKTGDYVAGHGSVWNHDRQVPILFWWPGVKRQDRAAPAQVVDIAPTLAAIAGIAPPVPVDGQCLDLGGNCPK
ncbi:alkaline phosphatase family protein [Rhizorhabdus dicambivorans]|nr:alkaline phosphatase family protein [Rhizorhabdus dicambivorans]